MNWIHEKQYSKAAGEWLAEITREELGNNVRWRWTLCRSNQMATGIEDSEQWAQRRCELVYAAMSGSVNS